MAPEGIRVEYVLTFDGPQAGRHPKTALGVWWPDWHVVECDDGQMRWIGMFKEIRRAA
jgi:hypothetical protein